jgi:hypothetical protein
MWRALEGRLNERERQEFETARERSKAELEKLLDLLDAMSRGTDTERQAHWERRWVVENWCQAQEIGHFLKWAARTKFHWRAWQQSRAAFVRGEGAAP